MAGPDDQLQLRPYEAGDEAAVLALLEASLGWVPDDQYAAFFRWKHQENAFGPSPAWVAVDGDRVVGYRTFLRWEWRRDGQVVRAVRAVDTATHPDHQGRGIFSRLTRHALEELRADGVAFVFNTPNDNSRPGYLKMGWRLLARLPVLARPRSPWAAVRLLQARVPAEKWTEPNDLGLPAAEALADHGRVGRLLEAVGPGPGLATDRTPAFLAWRYGFGPLGYRVLPLGRDLDEGVAVFRLRRRGPLKEAAICDALVPGGDERAVGRLLRGIVRRSGADYGLRIGGPGNPARGFLPIPGQGPTLVWRDVCETEPPPLDEWRLSLGDVELF